MNYLTKRIKIGIFSTFIEDDSLTLVKAVERAIQSGNIPNAKVAFIFSNREYGESPTTNVILDGLENRSTPLITYSAAKFEPDLRRKAREEEQNGNLLSIGDWRNLYGEQVLKKIPPTDLDLLLGDMWIWGQNLCKERNGINLHPALPTGPKGEWYKVIWQLIKERQNESGVMIHKITPELDRGSAIAYCRFPIRGNQFDSLWNQLPQREEDLDRLIQQELSKKEKTTYPLHRKIREYGFNRETPLIIQTTRAFAEGSIRVEDQSVVNHNGEALVGGYNLTSEVNQELGVQFKRRMNEKEVK